MFILATLFFSSQANALIIDSKDWKFIDSYESWYDIANRYDADGGIKCSIVACPGTGVRRQIWASAAELSAMVAYANQYDLFNVGNENGTFLGAEVSVCQTFTNCVWHGWLRDEDPNNITSASSAIIDGYCTDHITYFECDVLLGVDFVIHPKSFADEFALGNGPAITGHFVYTEVNAPNAIALMLLGLFALVFARNNTLLKLRKK